MNDYLNDYEVETEEYLKHGLTLFQCRLYGITEEEHIKNYCSWMKPSGVVVDMGSGIGSMGRGILKHRPNVKAVINVTNSPVQADYILRMGERVILCDYHHVPEIPDGTANFVMFNETIGHGNPQQLLQEAARMLADGGRVVVKDFAPKNPADYVDVFGWNYKVVPVQELIGAAGNYGLRCTLFSLPEVSDQIWQTFMENSQMVNWHGSIEYPLDSALFVFKKVSK